MKTPSRWQAGVVLVGLLAVLALLPALSPAASASAPSVPFALVAAEDSTWEDAKEKIGGFFNSRDRVIQVAAVGFLVGVFIIMRGKPGT